MVVKYSAFIMLLILTAPAYAEIKFIANFKIYEGSQKIDFGKAFITKKEHVWSKGLKRAYLTMSCINQVSGKQKKQLTLTKHFTGLRITHQLVNDEIRLTVNRIVVKPKLTEIRAIAKDDCKNIAPEVNTVTETYVFPAKAGMNESKPFGEQLTFNITLHKILSAESK